MLCASCGHDNRAGRKFCVHCGAVETIAGDRGSTIMTNATNRGFKGSASLTKQV
jgi:zinc-ribbon domain